MTFSGTKIYKIMSKHKFLFDTAFQKIREIDNTSQNLHTK